MLTTLKVSACRISGAALVAAALLVGAAARASASDSPGSEFTVPPSEVAGDVGDITLVGDDGRPISGGDGSTHFFVKLPDGAACPGDSANDQWRVSSFLIPVTENPLDVLFGSSGPEPPWTSGRYPLFSDVGNLPIALDTLRKNSAPGSPGVINPIAETSFTVHAQNLFPGGHYRLGIACSYFTQTTQYWDTEVIMAAAPGGKDSELTWTLPNAPPTTTDTDDSGSSRWLWIVIAAGAVAALAAIVFLRGRTSATRRQTRSHDEPLRHPL